MIGIIAAMDLEVEAIQKIAQMEKSETVAGIDFHFGKIKDQDIVICKSGIGKSTASMATAILCLQNNPKAIINVGTAGGLKDEEEVLDVVISDDIVQADFDTSPLDGPSGRGLRYHADRTMLEKCIDAAKKCGIRYHVGTIASQDLFMSREEDFAKLMKYFPDSICSEMEAGAVASVATAFNVPFVICRGLSDVVTHEGNPMEFSTYASKASAQSAKLIETLIEEI